jgi:GGDEF domain-containing protein
MTSDAFEHDGSRFLPPGSFDAVLAAELKRAVRSQTFLSLVAVEVRRVWDGLTVNPDDGILAELSEIVWREVRDTDLLAQAERGSIWLVLLDADVDGSRRVMERVVNRIDSYRFATPVSIVMGAACCPTHAVDADSLKREAASRPMLSARRHVQPGASTDRS